MCSWDVKDYSCVCMEILVDTLLGLMTYWCFQIQQIKKKKFSIFPSWFCVDLSMFDDAFLMGVWKIACSGWAYHVSDRLFMHFSPKHNFIRYQCNIKRAAQNIFYRLKCLHPSDGQIISLPTHGWKFFGMNRNSGFWIPKNRPLRFLNENKKSPFYDHVEVLPCL